MRKSKWFVFLAVLSLFALLGAACADDGGGGGGGGGGGDILATCEADEFGCVEVAEGDPIVLGTLLVISGENAQLGQDSQNGAVLGADYIDGTFDGAAALLGHDIEFEHQDDGCSPEGGTAGARSLVADAARIVAVIGTSCSSSALGVADTILGEEGVVLISPSNTSPELAGPDHQPFYFRTAHNDIIQGAAVARFVSEELTLTKAATIHDGSTYADGLQGAFAESFSELGGEITAQEAVGVGDKDMSPVLTQIAGTGPEFLFYPVFIPEGGAITKQAREIADLEGVALGGADGMLSPDFVKAAGAEDAEGVYLSGPDLEGFASGDFYADEFLPAYNDQFGEPTSVFHAHSYDAVQIVLQAIEAVAGEDGGTLYIPRTALRDAIAATSGYAGIVGELTCDEFGDCNPGASMSVSQVTGGEFEVIWKSSE